MTGFDPFWSFWPAPVAGGLRSTTFAPDAMRSPSVPTPSDATIHVFSSDRKSGELVVSMGGPLGVGDLGGEVGLLHDPLDRLVGVFLEDNRKRILVVQVALVIR